MKESKSVINKQKDKKKYFFFFTHTIEINCYVTNKSMCLKRGSEIDVIGCQL